MILQNIDEKAYIALCYHRKSLSES
jgi:hypothetical protein